MAFVLPGSKKNSKTSKTLLWAQLGCSACTLIRGSSICAGPISLLGYLLVLLQLGKQRGVADLLEAPWVEVGSQFQAAWNSLPWFPTNQEQDRWWNVGIPWGFCPQTSLRASTGTLHQGSSVPSWIQAVLCFFTASPIKSLQYRSRLHHHQHCQGFPHAPWEVTCISFNSSL